MLEDDAQCCKISPSAPLQIACNGARHNAWEASLLCFLSPQIACNGNAAQNLTCEGEGDCLLKGTVFFPSFVGSQAISLADKRVLPKLYVFLKGTVQVVRHDTANERYRAQDLVSVLVGPAGQMVALVTTQLAEHMVKTGARLKIGWGRRGGRRRGDTPTSVLLLC